jgi:phytol kinase
MRNDTYALIASFVYVFGMIGAAEALRKWRGYSVEFTRKFIHVAVGMWSYGTVLLFERRALAVIPPLAFVAINAVSFWKGTFKAMETGEKQNLGTVYFPLSFAAVVWSLWNQPAAIVASLMPMTWGDALAAVLGRAFGKHHFSIIGSRRSLEGSAAMLLASWLATSCALLLLGPGRAAPGHLAAASAATALAATVVEALSPWGIDNLTVPAVSAVTLVSVLGS